MGEYWKREIVVLRNLTFGIVPPQSERVVNVDHHVVHDFYPTNIRTSHVSSMDHDARAIVVRKYSNNKDC
jgi:hypothetical protein